MSPYDNPTQTGEYIGRLFFRMRTGDLTPIRRWLSTRCNECGQSGTSGDHVTVGGYVAIGCQSYLQINPNALGIRMPDWKDWTRVEPDVEIGPWRPTGLRDSDPGMASTVTITLELQAPAGAPRSETEVRKALLSCLDSHDFEVLHDPAEDRNGYQTLVINAR